MLRLRLNISAWLVVAFTFERLIVVRYPLKRYKICTIRRAKWTIACTALVVLIVQILSLFSTDLIGGTSTTDASVETNATISESDEDDDDEEPDYYYHIMRVVMMIETGFTLVIPPVLVVVMNGYIVHGLFQFKKTFQTDENNPHYSVPNPEDGGVNIQVHEKSVFV